MTSEQVRRLRYQLSMTQAELAEAIGTTKNTVWRWENGYHPVSRPYAKLLRWVEERNRIYGPNK